jgi:rsbT antagonist protein RsbS
MGADCIISGIRPQIAQTMVHLQINLSAVTTKATMAEALRFALKRRALNSRYLEEFLTEGVNVLSRIYQMDRIPILQMGEFLLVIIQVDMHDHLASALQDDLTNKIAKAKAKGVLIDISSLDIVDSFIGRMLANTSAMARVLDAQDSRRWDATRGRNYLGGARAHLNGVHTALDVEKGMAMLRRLIGIPDLDEDTGATEKISVAASGDIVAVRHAVRRQAVKINLSLVDQTKIVTAASELVRMRPIALPRWR